MRLISTLFLTCWALWAFGQAPPNDECAGAINLPLGTPPPCPSTASVTNVFNHTNINATPTTPYPTFSDCAVGGQTSSPADEVWFTFTPNSNVLTITLSGQLSVPNIVIFSGTNCNFLVAVECARGSSSPLTLQLSVVPNQPYYMMISGGSVGDQGNFTLTMVSSRDCDPCLQAANLVASPPPLNGTYNSGQTVNFCYTITQWDVTGTVEWLHAVELEFGSGWDLSSLQTTPPPSCGGDGSWGWYDTWQSCGTGQTFGPGFAYDSSNGVGCGGSPNDGDPGNNWGDGTGPCSTIGDGSPASVTFCWSIEVGNCPPNTTGNSLSIIINVLSDGDSGSWTQVGCNSGNEYNFLASTVCCDDGDPTVDATPTRCPQVSDGTITAEGSTFGAVYNYFIFNNAGQLIFEDLNVIGPITASNLPAGSYSVLAVNVESGCQRSQVVEVVAGQSPEATADNGGPYCPGDPVSLFANFNSNLPPGSVTYQWTGPGGFTSNQQNPTNATQGGNYNVVVTIDGCPTPPASTNVVFQPATVSLNAMPNTVCPGEMSVITASGAESYVWSTGETGNSITVNPFTTTTYYVTATNSVGCTIEEEIVVETLPVPDITLSAPEVGCEGDQAIITATGGPFSQYQWSDGQTGNPVSVDLIPPQGTFSVTATDAMGCKAEATIDITVYPRPIAAITASPETVCAGSAATLTATGGVGYNWSSGQQGASISVTPSATTTYTVTVTAVDGCVDSESVTVTVVQPVSPPVVTCTNTTSTSVTFSWLPVTGASGYQVNVISGPQGTLDGTTYSVTGLSPGQQVTVQVTANSGTVCPDASTTITCVATSCPPVDVQITGIGNFCAGAGNTNQNLNAAINGGTGNGTLTWIGPGVINSNQGIFHPDSAGVGIHLIQLAYVEGLCTYTDTLFVTVNPRPSVSLDDIPNPICLTDTIVLNYTGDASNQAVFSWDFAGGNATPGTGVGPHLVSWTSEGSKNLTLSVTENGCTSDTLSVDVQVDPPIDAPVISCANGISDITFSWNEVVGASGYQVVQLIGPSGTQNGNSYSVGGLTPGDSVSIRIIALNDGPCGPSTSELTCVAQACPNINIEITPVDPICLTATAEPVMLNASITGGMGTGERIWTGPGVDVVNNTFNPLTAGAGVHPVQIRYVESGCIYYDSIFIQVNALPDASFVLSGPVCVNDTVTITYSGGASPSAVYNWDFDGGSATPGTGQGPHLVSWTAAGTKSISLSVSDNGCTSVEVLKTLIVEAPLPAPVITCGAATPTSVTFSWNPVPGASTYNVVVLSGQTGTQSGNSYTVNGLAPQTSVQIQVSAEGNSVCGPSTATASCSSSACPVFTINIASVPDICFGSNPLPLTLQSSVSGGTGNGTGVWSGPGITNPTTGAFNPNAAGIGQHTITYTYSEGPCTGSATRVIRVLAVPTAEFNVAPSQICTGQSTQILFVGTADANANYSWSFDGGTATPGTGQGPHSVSWATPGNKTVTLSVTQDGCTSSPFTQNISVSAPLAAPVITCNSTPSQIVFSWNPVAGATSYGVTVISGPTGVLSGTTYTVSGLSPGTTVQIRVTALTGNVCGPSSAELSCVAQNCPTVNININPVAPICLSTGTASITLNASISGGAGGGTRVWSGPGITNPNTGIFSAQQAGPGSHTITLTYSEGTCTYTQSTVIEVAQQPVAEFGAPDVICLGDTALLSFSGLATPGSVYNWNFGGGNAVPGTGAGPHTVSWSTPGLKIISLIVSNGNCVSAPFEDTILVSAPLVQPQITCTSTNSSVTFSWPDVPGAGSYQVTSTSGPQGTLNGTTYTVTGLTPNQSVSISVTAVSSGQCPNTMATATCAAENCPPLSLTLNGTATICAGQPGQVTFQFTGSSSGPFTVSYSLNGGAPQTEVFTNGQSLPVAASSTTTLTINSITDNSIAGCTYSSAASWTINVAQPVQPGTPVTPPRICAGADETVVLADLLTGESAGGIWTETSASPSSGAAFNPAAGTFRAVGQTAGTYTFQYVVAGQTPCPPAQATVSVILEPAPIADAGSDQALTCNMDMVSLGGANTTVGPGITYLWTSSTPGVVITNPSSRIIETTQAGIYRLQVTNDTGCSSFDEVLVSSDAQNPEAIIVTTPISCFQSNDGSVRVTLVNGGRPPYSFSLNGGAFTDQQLFVGLGARAYVLTVRDANGCTSEVNFSLDEPPVLTVEIQTNLTNSENIVEFGDSVRLEALFQGGSGLDSIRWRPDSVSMDDLFITVSPLGTSTYGVAVWDQNGCRAEDEITIFVERKRRVFIPNSFSPNEDGINDVFVINADPKQVKIIKSFKVYNRWGEAMFELYDFQPNNPTFGWNGKHRDEWMNPDVFVYFTEVEFLDGEVVLYRGDFLLLK